MNNSNELHIIFGSGPIGAAVMRELIRKGRRVRIVTRSGKPSLATGDQVSGVEFVKADAYDQASAIQAAQGATHIYQCAQPEYHEWVEKFPPLQASIIEAAAATGAKLIVMENLYMYGDTHGTPINESLPDQPHTRKGKVRLAMSEAVFAAHRSGKIRATAGRASDFVGPAYMVLADMVFYAALDGKKASGTGSLDVPHTFTYTEDVGKALVILGERDEALGQAWIIPSAPAVTQREMLQMVFDAAGKPAKIGVVNGMMMRMAGLFIPGAREMVEMLYEFEKPFVVDSTKFQRTFGMQPTPLREAIQQTVQWFRAHPKQTA
jgi:nucleoside-diphosphate-sugar epimerase